MQRVATDLPAEPVPINALSRNAIYTTKLSYSAEMRSARRRPRSVPGGPLSPPTGTPQRRRRLRGKSSAWIALHRYRYCRRRRPGHDAGVAGVGMKRPPGGFSRWPNRGAKPIRGAQGWLSPLPTAIRHRQRRLGATRRQLDSDSAASQRQLGSNRAANQQDTSFKLRPTGRV